MTWLHLFRLRLRWRRSVLVGRVVRRLIERPCPACQRGRDVDLEPDMDCWECRGLGLSPTQAGYELLTFVSRHLDLDDPVSVMQRRHR